MKNSRRGFLKNSLFATAGISTGLDSLENKQDSTNRDTLNSDANDKEAFSISLFSKHLHWLNYEELAKLALELGFDAIDLTVRAGGHVLPENVERDLPKAVADIRKAGLDVYIISTDINDADDPLSIRVIKTASALGIKHYRMKPYYYNEKISIESNMSIFEKKMKTLAKLNAQYKIFGEYQNHSLQYDPGVYYGAYYGSTIWDLYTVLKKINSPWLSSQFDIGHATIESTRSWGIGLELLTPFIKSLHVKDYIWVKNGDNWDLVLVPIGEGMVDFKKFFETIKKRQIKAPITFYYGYPIGDEKNGADIATMKKGLIALKNFMKGAELVR